ncbi:MAG: D-alanyl-D-alanine carboxypeptidase family protein [Bacillota bacterium]
MARLLTIAVFVITCLVIAIFSNRGRLTNFQFSIQSSGLRSSHAILVRLKDHAVLMEQSSEERVYPASLTKIMTAIVAMENLTNLQEKVELPAAIFSELYYADASMAGFRPGERVTAIDLIYGAMLPSGAECSIGLANHIAGSERAFVQMMNHKAFELDMDGTHFFNATGLHDWRHYTTVKDLAALLSYALQNETFRTIFTSSSHLTQPTNLHPEGMTLSSTLFQKLANTHTDGGVILGGKTGYTEQAGLCLASLANVNGKEYILVTADAKGDHESEQYNITDAIMVYNTLGKQ